MTIYEDGSYLRNNPGWHEEHSFWKARHVKSILTKNSLKPKTIAEIGCGAGQILVELSSSLPEVENFTGYEISPQAFEICQQKKTEKILFSDSDVLLYPPETPFDIAMAIDVFEHVEDYFGFIRRMKSVGRFQLFHIPLELSVSSILRPATLARSRREVGHIQFFTRETALATLEGAGLKVIDVVQTSVAEDQALNMGAKLMRVPRKVLSSISDELSARIFGGYHILVLTESS